MYGWWAGVAVQGTLPQTAKSLLPGPYALSGLFGDRVPVTTSSASIETSHVWAGLCACMCPNGPGHCVI